MSDNFVCERTGKKLCRPCRGLGVIEDADGEPDGEGGWNWKWRSYDPCKDCQGTGYANKRDQKVALRHARVIAPEQECGE